MVKRYILSKGRYTVHDREHLTERCNTDQIKHRDEADSQQEAREKNYRYSWGCCVFCMPQGWPLE